MNRFLKLPLVLAGATLAAAALASACSDSDPFQLGDGDNGGGTSSAGGAGGGTGGAAFVDNGETLFAGIEDDLVTACAGCHEPGGLGDAPFLATPDRYASILAWPGIVVPNPDDSLFTTYAVTGGGHSGTNIDSVAGLQDRVRAWLEAEAAAISKPIDGDTPHLDPITPILGFNAIYLTPLDSKLEGVAITFTAEELTDHSLQLNDIEVHTTSATGLHVVHPVFAVYPKGKDGDADPVDSFAGLDARYDVSSSSALGVGMVILTNWEPEAKLGLGFEVAEAYSSSTGEGGGGQGGGGATGGCNDVGEFDASAKTQFQNRCFSCHGGNNGQATAAVDMSDLQTNSGAACSQIKNRVNTANPAQSQIFITTDPNGNAAHPFKFGGDANQFNAFKTAVTTWINAE